jgi:hypothetical protein
MANVDLRTFAFLDCMQPQLASQVAATARGFLPVVGQAALYVEIAPGIEINRLTDVAIKTTAVQPGLQVVERAFGLLEIHHEDQGQVKEAGRAILENLELEEVDRLQPRIVTSQTIKDIHDYQSQLVNRTSRSANLLLPGDMLYILEVHPAGYAALAANEAEKNARVKIVEVRGSGAFGRVYFCGEEAEVEVGRDAVHRSLESLDGRANVAK